MSKIGFIFSAALMLISTENLRAEKSGKVIVEVSPGIIYPLLGLPGVDYLVVGTAKQAFEKAPRPGLRTQDLPIVLRDLTPDSVVKVESSTGQELRTLLFVNGQNELRISDLEPRVKYSLVVKDPNKTQPLKIENVEAGDIIRIR